MMFTIRTHPITTRVHQIPGGAAGRIKSDDTVTRVHTCSYSTYLGREPAYNPIADKYAAMYLIIYGSVKTPGTWKTNKTRLSLHRQTPADWHTRTHRLWAHDQAHPDTHRLWAHDQAHPHTHRLWAHDQAHLNYGLAWGESLALPDRL
jgi:hypothetical protein